MIGVGRVMSVREVMRGGEEEMSMHSPKHSIVNLLHIRMYETSFHTLRRRPKRW